jgi:hypothetical protein
LGVEICHDMFYGLVGHRLRRAGAGVLVDLTAGNVNLAKWRNVVRARSAESGGPFLCTMGHSPGESGASAGLAYRAGRRLVPAADTTRPAGAGGYVVYHLGGRTADDLAGDGQAHTDKRYRDITVSLGTGRPADVAVSSRPHGVEVGGPRPGESCGVWRRFACRAGSVGVLALPLSELSDPVAVHRLDAPCGSFDHHLLLYHSPEPPARLAQVLTLMKLRAVEHRAGVCLLAGGVREVVKTNRYKNIQRFVERDGVFGLNAEFLGGTWSTAGAGSDLGIPRERFPAYRSLLG